MITVFKTRRDMIAALCPPDSIGLEIGVQRGVFAQQILEATNVRLLHLLDAWEEQEGGYYDDPANISQGGQDANYKHVCEQFQTNPRVRIHKGFSPEALEVFADYALDWTFVDANHAPRAALHDLLSVERIVKPSGLIMGHDYTVRHEALQRGYGVYEAVQIFTRLTKWKLHAVTHDTDDWASFALKRGE